MLADAILDVFQGVASWFIGLLPQASTDAASAIAADPSAALHTLASNPLITGGVGVLINGGMFAAMVTSWLVVELAIQTVRGIIWAKKALLV
jgi:hypothetical protein